jgi:chromosome partitioning protein
VQLAGFLRTIFRGDVLKQEFLKSTVMNDASNSNNTVMELEPSAFTRKSYERLLESIELIVDEVEELMFAARRRSALEAASDMRRAS